MRKTKVKYTNHRDRAQIGTVIEVDPGRAKQLIRDGLAVAAPANAPVGKKAGPNKGDEAKPKDDTKTKAEAK